MYFLIPHSSLLTSHLLLKLYFRSLFSTFFSLEISLFLKSKHTCKDILRETAYLSVKAFSGFVKVATGCVDAVFCTLQLRLQLKEVLVCLEVRVSLNAHEEA